MKKTPPKERFWPKVDKTSSNIFYKGTRCLVWTACTVQAKGGHKYGRFWFNNKDRMAHRVAYEMEHGSIPKGMQICHHCDNTLCVNINHLFLGTQIDNMQDCVNKGRTSKGEHRYFSKLTDIKVKAIRKDKRPQREIATDYSVNQSQISSIKTKRNWKHIK